MEADLEQLKLEYAAQLLRCDDPFKAAFATTADSGLALQIAKSWPKDLAVLKEKERLMQSGDAKSFLPTKETQAKDLYAMAQNEKEAFDDRLKAHRLFAEIMGHIEKPTQGGNINIMAQGVMVVPMASSDEDWEQRAKKQQAALIGNGTIN